MWYAVYSRERPPSRPRGPAVRLLVERRVVHWVQARGEGARRRAGMLFRERLAFWPVGVC